MQDIGQRQLPGIEGDRQQVAAARDDAIANELAAGVMACRRTYQTDDSLHDVLSQTDGRSWREPDPLPRQSNKTQPNQTTRASAAASSCNVRSGSWKEAMNL